MRISDWSSDVCSSDLRLPQEPAGCPLGVRGRARREPARQTDAAEYGNVPAGGGSVHPRRRRKQGEGCRDRRADSRTRRTARKSVVEGKGVSVRVDIGGRRIINNKTQHKKISKN